MKVVVLCKKISDPPGETIGEWREAACVICDARLRMTIQVREKLAEKDHTPFSICFDCALLGPEVIKDWMDIL